MKKYEKPTLAVVIFETTDVIRTSQLEGSDNGSGDEYEW